MECTNCGSEKTQPDRDFRDARFGVILSYWRCNECLVRFQDVDHQELKDWYSTGKYRREAGVSLDEARKLMARRADRQLKWLHEEASVVLSQMPYVLDIGAYLGVTVEKLRELGLHAEGYDLDEVSAKQAGDLVVSDTTELECESYDLLWMSHILEHTPSAIDLLEDWEDWCDDYIFVEIPGNSYQLPHLLVFDEAAFLQTVECAGLDLIARDGAKLRAVLKVK